MAYTSPVDDYIARFPWDVRAKLQQLRSHVLTLAPEAEEKLAYGIPTYKAGKNIFHFAAYSGHIGLYPGAAAIQAHPQELAVFKTSKGAIQIPLSGDLPLALVTRLVRFNLAALGPAPRRPASSRKTRSPR